MAQTSFSGPVASANGFVGPVAATTVTASGTLAVTGNSTLSGTANVIVVPTADPHVVGALWNNGGTLAVSAG